MSRSRNTEKKSVYAARRIARDEDGSPVIPRVIVRRARRGDIHPLPGQILRDFLKLVPIEYLYGLRDIELRARESEEIGRPFGYYRPSEKAIVLYSLPWSWRHLRLSRSMQNSIELYKGIIRRNDQDKFVDVEGPDRIRYGMWFYTEVVLHELGHHIRNQYRRSRGRLGRRIDEEIIADLHGERLMRILLRTLKARRDQRRREGN